ncbi:MAG: hypothetical protein J6S61_00945, partial [Elusimicrobiaceae bacterium]|nr:hypothetical protein [Elusimicrobiaceae bacterium]
FILLFLLSAVTPAIYAEDFISSKDMRDEITKTVKTEMDNQNDGLLRKGGDTDTDGGLINVISFSQDIVTKKGTPVTEKKECIAIVIDDAWAIVSGKCFLSKGDKLFPYAGEVNTSYNHSFSVFLGGSWNPVQPYLTKNLYLLRAVNESGVPLFEENHKANLAFVSAKDKEQFDSSFSNGTFEVNITKRKEAENVSHPYYGVEREIRDKKIKEIYLDSNDTIARVSSFPKLRAGDPLFYTQKGKKYLLGFAKAINHIDNAQKSNYKVRTDNVILLTGSDKQEIINKIKSVDPEAATRIEKRALVK